MWKERKKKEEEERIMPSLVATPSALTRTMCVRTHYLCNKIVKKCDLTSFTELDNEEIAG